MLCVRIAGNAPDVIFALFARRRTLKALFAFAVGPWIGYGEIVGLALATADSILAGVARGAAGVAGGPRRRVLVSEVVGLAARADGVSLSSIVARSAAVGTGLAEIALRK